MAFKLALSAAVAALALSLIGVSAASASEFTASSYPATITGEGGAGAGEWITEAGSVECEEHFEGTLEAPSNVLWLDMSLTNCKGLGFLSATVHFNECQVGLYSDESVAISCPSGKYIEVTAGTCVFHVGSQSGLKSVQLMNSGAHVLVLMSVADLTYNVTKDPFLCAFNGTGHKTGMSWIFNEVLTIARLGGGTIAIT